jgi:hypothetical protein
MQSGNYRALSALAFLQLGMAMTMLAIAKWAIGLDRVVSK